MLITLISDRQVEPCSVAIDNKVTVICHWWRVFWNTPLVKIFELHITHRWLWYNHSNNDNYSYIIKHNEHILLLQLLQTESNNNQVLFCLLCLGWQYQIMINILPKRHYRYCCSWTLNHLINSSTDPLYYILQQYFSLIKRLIHRQLISEFLSALRYYPGHRILACPHTMICTFSISLGSIPTRATRLKFLSILHWAFASYTMTLYTVCYKFRDETYKAVLI